MKPARIIKDHIVVQPDDPALLRRIFPTMKEASGYAAVPHTLDHARMLKNLGFDAPSPIRTQYRWPIRPGRTPGWWQVDTADFMTMNRRAHVHNSMRTRKTLTTLWAYDFLRGKGVVKKALIIAPLSSLERAWGDQIFFDLPHLSYAVLHGTAEKRRKLLAEDKDIYIINHDGVKVLLPELKKRTDIDLIVVDEVHEYFNQRTEKWKVCASLIRPETWVWGLTGTPTPQDPTNAYGQMKLITPENYKGSFTAFKNTTMMQVSTFKWLPRKGSEHIVAQALAPSIRFERTVVTDLEPCLTEHFAELSKEQKHHYNELMRQAVTEIDGSTITAVNAAALAGKISQCCCGVVYGTQGEFLRMDFGPRLKVVEELIEANDEKVLVFVPFTGALEAVAAELRKRWSVAVVDGSVPATKRSQIFKDFQEKKEPHVIVAHPATMAYSLELTAASLIIWYAHCASGNKTYQQACARIDGGGQKVKIDIAHVYGTAAERKIYASLQERGRLQDIILSLLKENH